MDMLYLFTDINFYIALSISVLYSISIVLGIYSYEHYRSKSLMLRKVDIHPVARSLATIAFIYIIYVVGWNNLLAKAAKSPIYIPIIIVLGFMFGFLGMMSWFGVYLRELRSRLERGSRG